ncbi:MAG: shikimate kinase [Gammaproteobacteria bacterium]|nr:shikimate kinase [Gammaproteobacteria bacterium]
MSNLIVLFGKIGAGKNFVGNILAEYFDFYFWDADEALTSEMLECIKLKQPFTPQMRNQLVNLMIEHISLLKSKYANIVVAQALYKEANRQSLRLSFPEAHFICIEANLENRGQRLAKLKSEINNEYARIIDLNYEQPTSKCDIVANNEDSEFIIKQLKDLLKLEVCFKTAIKMK